jgi:hypothetical protein
MSFRNFLNELWVFGTFLVTPWSNVLMLFVVASYYIACLLIPTLDVTTSLLNFYIHDIVYVLLVFLVVRWYFFKQGQMLSAENTLYGSPGSVAADGSVSGGVGGSGGTVFM